MAGNTISGVNPYTNNTSTTNNTSCKLVMGTTGGSVSAIIFGLGISHLRSKVSLKEVRDNAKIMQIKARPIDKIPILQQPIRFNSELADEIASYIHKPEFAQWAKEKGSATVKRHSDFIKKHNMQCARWEKDSMRGFLEKSLKQAKRTVARDRATGVVFLIMSAVVAASTAYICSKDFA